MYLKRFALLVACAFLAFPALAQYQDEASRQEEGKVVLTLEDALKVALSENTSVKVADMEIERQQYARKGSYAALLPQVSVRPQEAEGLLRFRQAGRGRRRVPGWRHGRHDGLPDEPHHVLHRAALCRHRRPVRPVRGPGCGQGERLFRADGNGPYPLGHLRSQRADAGGELPALGEPPSQRRPGGTGRRAGARIPSRDGRVREAGLLRHPLRERGVQGVQFRL